MTTFTPQLVYARVWVLRAAGLTLRQIATTIGCGYGTVQKAAAMPPPPPPPRPAFYADSPGPGACHWPISENRPWRFCSEPREAGGVYCPAHRRSATAGRSWQAEPMGASA